MNNKGLREKLIDEKSRIIFDARMNYKRDKSLLSFYQYLKANGEKYAFREVDEYIEKSGLTNIYIWGNDDFSVYSYYVLKDAGYSICGLISKDSCVGINDINFVTIEEVEYQLKNGFIIIFDRDIGNVSKEILNRYSILRLFSHVVGRVGKQYFDFFLPDGEEYFLDGGSLDGSTSIQFVDWCCGNYGAVYAFEANPLMVDNCRERLEQIVINDKLSFFDCALWDRNEYVMFNNSGSKWDAHVCHENGVLVKTNSIDNLLNNRKVTFIKFDIEGSELKALQGAYNCILQNRPRMAISVYHKATDLEEIMNFLDTLGLEYKYALRHYHSDTIETVLYAF